MRKYEVVVPENVEMADIHAIQARVKKHNLLTVALLIPLFAGYALRESSETLGSIVFVLSIALMLLGFISGRGDEKRLPRTGRSTSKSTGWTPPAREPRRRVALRRGARGGLPRGQRLPRAAGCPR